MTTIKSYTSVEQSRKLAEILPNESADMYYSWIGTAYLLHAESYNEIIAWRKEYAKTHNNPSFCTSIIPCWSLAALLNVMPKDESIECSISFGYYNGKGEYIEKWLCAFEKEGEKTDDYIIETFDGDNPVDACVAMIEMLHKLNLL